MKPLLASIANLVRLNNWWNYKLPPLMALAYAGVWYSGIYFKTIVLLFPAILLWLFAAASLGHLINDYFDRETDAAAKKDNALQGLSSTRIILLIVVTAILSVLPVLLFVRSKDALVVIGVQVLLFFLYSSPLIRLKTKPIAGILADAVYAHVLPAIVIYLALGVTSFPSEVAFLTICWLLAQGLRNILLHQASDYQNDLSSEIETFAISYGPDKTYSIINYVLLPLELFCFLILLALLGWWNILSAVFIFWLVKWLAEKYVWRSTLQFKVQPHASLSFVNNLYEEWLPIVFLVALTLQQPPFIFTLLAHLVIFQKPSRNLFKLFSDIAQHVFNRQ